MRLILSILFCLFIEGISLGQSTAVGKIQKGKWKSAEESLRKTIHKDSTDTEATFTLAWYYQAAANPAADMDSAHRYILKSARNFLKAAPKEKEKLKRFPIDSSILASQRRQIDSIAFAQAKAINTEEGYNHFIGLYTTASQKTAATELRDEVAFIDAIKTNTAHGYEAYLTRYPASIRGSEIKLRYERLVYADQTRDGKLKSYVAFYHSFPQSSSRADAEKNIFEISTAAGKPSDFVEFLKKYPTSNQRSRAIALLYHLLKDDEHESGFLSDSLKEIQHKEKGYWVPVLRNGKFGFIDQSGIETIKPTFDSIRHEYNCGNIHTDYLHVAGGIINRAGNWIVKGEIDHATDIGFGFLKIDTEGCIKIVHKSGLTAAADCDADVKLIAKNFIAFQSGGKWGLRTLSERPLLDAIYDEVEALDTLVVFVRNGKKIIATPEQIATVAEKNAFIPSLVFDDVHRMGTNNYLVRNGSLEGVLNEKLEFVIPLGRHTITRSSAGFILKDADKEKITGMPGVSKTQPYDQVVFYGNWVKLRLGKQLQLYNMGKKKIDRIQADSIWFENKLAFVRRRDSISVCLNAATTIGFPADDKVAFMKAIDSSRFLFVTDKRNKTAFNADTGKKLFTFTADAIEYVGENVFLVTKGGKKGLVMLNGKSLLPIEYNAIVPVGKPWASVFKDKKFGLYNLSNHVLIKPEYDRNVQPFSTSLLIAFKENGYGFIDLMSKPKSKFEFEEIRSWNDTAALVKKNFQWMIYAMRSGKILTDGIKDYHLVQKSPETVAVIRKNLSYGVISNQRGEIIPANFSDIINIGSSEEPMYFSEKNVEEAGIHVVVYYDKNGKLIRKQAYEDSEFERILCDEN